MGMSKSYLSYDDCRDALERALQSKKGIRLEFTKKSQAFRFVSRACHFRVMDRKESLRLYDENHDMYGRSPYDKLIITRPSETIVEITPIFLDLDSIALSEIE